MGSNPANLAVRFLLELGILVALAWWGWSIGGGVIRLVFAIVLPAAASLIWGVFNVPGDPSRSGNAPVPVPGVVRLAIELGLFALAVAAWLAVGATVVGVVFAVVVAAHYLISYDRIRWLLTGPPPPGCGGSRLDPGPGLAANRPYQWAPRGIGSIGKYTQPGRSINRLDISHAEGDSMRRLILLFAVLTATAGLVAVPAGAAAVMCNGLVATAVGTAGDDILNGTSGPDVIAGLGGDDIIRGFGGEDVLCGNGGNDLIIGGGAADWISGGPGDDWLRGSRGGDTLIGDKGHDALNGGPGADDLHGGNHRDVIRGGDKNDDMRGGKGEDTLIGGLGNDIARGNAARDFCDAEIESTCEAINLATRLHATGIGNQMFGDSTDPALLEFAALLGDPADEGDPDEDSGWIDSFSPFGTCPNDEVRVVRWGDVEIFNTRNLGEDGTFFTWEILDPLNDREDKELMTARGIRWGDTWAQLDTAYGNTLTTDYIDIWDLYVFYVDGNPSGVRGTFTGGDHFDTIFLLGGGTGCGE